MAVIETGTSTAGVANVNATFQLQTGVNDDSTKNGILAITARSDAGGFLGTPTDIDPECDQDFRLRVGADSIIFRETWSGAALNSSAWTSVATTMTATVTRGQLVMNAGSSVAANTVIRLQTYLAVPVAQTFPLSIKFPFKINAASMGITNQAWDFGLCFGVAATSNPTDGVRLNMSVAGVLTFETFFDSGAANPITIDYVTTVPLAVGITYQCIFVIGADSIQLWINDTLAGVLPRAVATPSFFSCGALPVYVRMFNHTSGPATATQLIMGAITASCGAMQNMMTNAEASLLYGCESGSGQGGATLGSLSRTVAAGTAPAAAVPTNTTAALGSGLGGDFLHTNTLAVNTYGIISSYQVPATAIGLNNKSLLITSVCIDTTVQTVLANVGAANYIWAIAFGHNAVTLATAASATARAPVLLTVGQQAAIGALAVGSQLQRIVADCEFVVHPGEFVQACVKNGGTVGTAGVLYHTIHFNGRWI